MTIQKVVVKNFKGIRDCTIEFNEGTNIIVGDNEAGKSTLLDALNLALNGTLNNFSPRNAPLNPFIFHSDCVAQALRDSTLMPPEVLVEVYLTEHDDFVTLKGTNNSLRENSAGIKAAFQLKDEYSEEYVNYVERNSGSILPIEMYEFKWMGFDGTPMHYRNRAVRGAYIDSSAGIGVGHPDRQLADLVTLQLTNDQRLNLTQGYRGLRESFNELETIQELNERLPSLSAASDKQLSLGLDLSTRAGWDSNVTIHLDGIPLHQSGKGEQVSVKTKLALKGIRNCTTLMIEEPENHLSHSNLNKLIGHIESARDGRQVIIVTHSSFVINKLGLGNTHLFHGDKSITLESLDPDTTKYFQKLSGHDTLRLVLCKRAILVEGPSDDLIVSKAYLQENGALPLENSVEIISVSGLAFKRFLSIAEALGKQVHVVTDNDGDIESVRKKYEAYESSNNISICCPENNELPTLEPQLLECNSVEFVEQVTGKKFSDKDSCLKYMIANKTDCALAFFEHDQDFEIPDYIKEAVNET